jgi:hypothetical protein
MDILETTVNRDLLLEFFLSFARFEYALKATGFFVRHAENSACPPKAEPDWPSFAASLHSTFNSRRNAEIERAYQYLSESPPNRQVIVNGALAWETPMRGTDSEIEYVLRMVRSVRNNLFHGGKHNIEVHETTERTEALLRSCLAVLNECLALAPTQQGAYFEAVL